MFIKGDVLISLGLTVIQTVWTYGSFWSKHENHYLWKVEISHDTHSLCVWVVVLLLCVFFFFFKKSYICLLVYFYFNFPFAKKCFIFLGGDLFWGEKCNSLSWILLPPPFFCHLQFGWLSTPWDVFKLVS